MKQWSKEIGPQRVGGTYYNGYWKEKYTVKSITQTEQGWEMEVVWQDGHTAWHATAWDPKRDKVL